MNLDKKDSDTHKFFCGKMLRYKDWCNRVLFSYLGTMGTQELYSKHDISFGSIAETLHHVYLMDMVWKKRLEGEETELSSRRPAEQISIGTLTRQQRDIDQWFLGFCDGTSELHKTIEFTFIGGEGGSMKVSDILLHVVNHGTYHRGHVVAMLNQKGKYLPATDFPVFLKKQD